jgi:hypothetical protein
MPAFKTLNIGVQLPTIDEARHHLLAEIRHAKQSGIVTVKIVHGYCGICNFSCTASRVIIVAPFAAARSQRERFPSETIPCL